MPLRKVAVFSLALLLLVTVVQARPSFSLKLYGGAGYWLTGGDFKPFFESTADRWKAVGMTGTFDLDWKPFAWEGGVQAVLMFTPNIGLALGVGYLSKTIDHHSSLKYGVEETYENMDSYKIQSIPVSLDVLFAVPAGPIRFLFSAGAAYYSSQVMSEQEGLYSEPHRIGQPNWKWDLLQSFESDRKGWFGLQAGLGIEIRLAGPVSLCLDGFYRFASFDDVRGTFQWDDHAVWTGGSTSDSFTIEQAKMWYSTSNVWGNIWHYLDISKTMPTSNDEARPFKISLDGPVARIGIKIGV